MTGFREQGHGTPLVLLHGISSGAASWHKQMVLSGYRVLAWDMPGYGESPMLPVEQAKSSVMQVARMIANERAKRGRGLGIEFTYSVMTLSRGRVFRQWVTVSSGSGSSSSGTFPGLWSQWSSPDSSPIPLRVSSGLSPDSMHP